MTTGDDGSPERARHPGTLRIGTIAGSDVLISGSWFVIAGIIAILIAPQVESVQPGLGPWKYVAGFAFAIVLYGSILLHEASHVLMAQRYGFPVSHITLNFLGGMTSIQGEARRPREEFLIAVVGPLTSVAVGLVALGALLLSPTGLIRLALEGLVWANLFVGLLNLVPGLPLDGGRALKAIVWGATGSVTRGTLVAGWIGRVAAVVLLTMPLWGRALTGARSNPFDYIWSIVIGIFLWQGATAAMRSARMRSRLPSLVARDLARRTLAVPENLPLAEAVRRAQEAGAGAVVTTRSDDQPAGIVDEFALHAVPDERRPWLPVSAVSRTLQDELRLPVDIDGEELVRAITRRPASEYLLVNDDGTIFGVLSTADVDAAFRAAAH